MVKDSLQDARCNKTYCAYCGDSFPLDDEAAKQVSAHIMTCPWHPMRGPEAERDTALAEVERLRETLRLLVRGNHINWRLTRNGSWLREREPLLFSGR